MTTEYAIETADLTKRFGSTTAVDGLSLKVPTGSVFAFLGRNGAGKTTTIRILLNALDRTSGMASILGRDCAKESLDIRKRTGYVAEGQTMYEWMKVDEIIRFCSKFYPGWDHEFTAKLKQRFELPGATKVGHLSRGTQGKLALLLAMAFWPELLILDEPTSGLDVIVRHDFLKGIIELVQDGTRAVFFSSHQVHEVERVADWVGIIDEGRMIWCSSMEDLKGSVKRLFLTFDSDTRVESVPGVLRIEGAGRQAVVTMRGFSDSTLAEVDKLHPSSVKVEDMSLEAIFMDLVGRAGGD